MIHDSPTTRSGCDPAEDVPAASTRISIVVPAHNEAAVIRRCLDALTRGARPGELEVLVVCNGCSDATAEIARGFGEPVGVIETEVASKANALNLGDAAASGFPRIYLDADVVMSLGSIRALAGALQAGNALAAAPSVETVFAPEAPWVVRAYYRFWMSLPYIQEGMMAAGVYAVSREGRGRFDRFPDLIADDGFFRLQFTSQERIEVAAATSTVVAPGTLADLIKIKTRSRLGVIQLTRAFPEHYQREAKSKGYGQALLAMARRPGLYLAALPYLVVTLIARHRARRMAGEQHYVWERDSSSRATNLGSRP